MIRAYSDHAANERTFFAWVRTGVVIVALGFVIEKFNLFLLVIASAERLSGPLARYDGLAIILVGLALTVAAAMRFIRVWGLVDDRDPMTPAAIAPSSCCRLCSPWRSRPPVSSSCLLVAEVAGVIVWLEIRRWRT